MSLSEVLATFDDIYSPRVVSRVNDYEVKVAHTKGAHVWHTHDHTDEFFFVIDGQFDIVLREPSDPDRSITLHAGDIFVVRKGVEHKPSSPSGAVLMFEPSGTSSTGDRHHGAIPDHVDSTTGHRL